MRINVKGQELWLDWEAWKAQDEFMKKKEKEYWDYHFSGQRTLDLFGVEGAKRILEEQDKRDEELRNGMA